MSSLPRGTQQDSLYTITAIPALGPAHWRGQNRERARQSQTEEHTGSRRGELSGVRQTVRHGQTDKQESLKHKQLDLCVSPRPWPFRSPVQSKSYPHLSYSKRREVWGCQVAQGLVESRGSLGGWLQAVGSQGRGAKSFKGAQAKGSGS